MDLFVYRAKDIKGNIIKGMCNEKEKDNIYKKLRQKGYFLINIKDKNRFKINSEKISLKDCSILCNKIYMLMSSGISITDTLDIIHKDFNKKHIKNSLKSVRNCILKGESIYDSFNCFSNIYPKFLLNMIHIGEESGKIDFVFAELKSFYESQNKFNKELKNALIYPTMVLIAFITMIYVLIHKVIPSFIGIFSELGGAIPKETLNMVRFVKIFNCILLILFIILVFIILGNRVFHNNYKVKCKLDSLKINTPILGKIYKNIFLCNFCKTMNIMIKSGMPINKSLKILEEITDNYIFKNNINALNRSIREGRSISSSLNKCGFSHNLLLSMINIGEESGKLEESFYSIYSILEKDIEENLRIFVKLIEPIIIIFMALIILVVFIYVFLPIMSLIDLI